MRHHVTATMLKQLRELREAKSNKRRGGVMVVPAVMGLDEWEAQAARYQDLLIASATEDRRKNTDPQPAPYVDPNIEHNEWNRQQWERTRRGAAEYLEAKQAAVKQATAPKTRKTVIR
jgi:hypothetical protein